MMKSKKYISRITLVFVFLSILFSFQNCGDVQLTKRLSSLEEPCTDDSVYTIDSNYNGTNYVSFLVRNSKGAEYEGNISWLINGTGYSDRNPLIDLGATPNCNLITVEAYIENTCGEALAITTTYLDPRCIVVEPTPTPTPTPTPPINPPVITPGPTDPPNLECEDPAGWTRQTSGPLGWWTQFLTAFPNALGNLREFKNVWGIEPNEMLIPGTTSPMGAYSGPVPLRSDVWPFRPNLAIGVAPVLYGHQYAALKFRTAGIPREGATLSVEELSAMRNGAGTDPNNIYRSRFSMVVSKKCGDFKTNSPHIPSDKCWVNLAGAGTRFSMAVQPNSNSICALEPNTDYYLNIIYAPIHPDTNPAPSSYTTCCHTSSSGIACDAGRYCEVQMHYSGTEVRW